MELLFPIVMIAFFWFAMIRPQRERLRQQRELVQSLQVGDDVVTAGGILGTITRLEDDVVHLDLGAGSTMRVLRPAVSSRQRPAASQDTP